MRIRNKEYQSLSRIELRKLCYDYPNNAQLGEKIREMAKVNIPLSVKDLK